MQRRVEHFASRSKWLSAGSVLQQFRHGDLFRARATELHDGEITMPWHDLQRDNKIILTSPQTTRMSILSAPTSCRSLTVSCIAQLDERFTRQKAAACQLNAFLPDFLNSSKYNDIGPKAAKPYRQFLQDGGLVALKTQYMRWQQTAVLGGTKNIQ
jgi:hypothetical protein